MRCLFSLQEKIIFCVCLFGSGLKVIFCWFAQAFILLTSLLKWVTDNLYYRRQKKVKSQQGVWHLLWDRLKDRLYRSKVTGSKKYPCGTLASALDHEDSWLFNTTLCFVDFKKLVRVRKGLPDKPFTFNLKIRPFSHTLPKTLDMSKNTDGTSWPSFKDL